MKRTALAIPLLALASLAHAQETSGPYLGVSLGTFDYEETDPALGLRISDTATSYQVFGGYRFTQHLMLEGSWGMTSDIGETFTGTDPVLGDVSAVVEGDYEALSVRVLGVLPLRKLDLFAGLGYFDSELDASVHYEDDFGVIDVASTTSDDGATVLAGLQFDFERISLRGTYEWFDTKSNVDASDLSVSALFRF